MTGNQSDETTTTLRCPVCGADATVRVDRHPGGSVFHCDVAGYECASGCQVDDETVRRIIGAQ
ncbi:MAG TPA: hypothetical protein VHS54_04035 [Jatrophihabitans sp.]|nr:hypothetical protein [Jatrophihabitans sp.]